MKKLFILWTLFSLNSLYAKIEDNSFLLEEAFNQEYGVYQFIQTYQTPADQLNNYDYSYGAEIPITDKAHQFSYVVPMGKTESKDQGTMGDVTINYRWQPLNKDGFLIAERFGLIIPTGSVKMGTGSGAYGFEFMQAATLPVSETVINHWNFGFSVIPNSKTPGHHFKRTISTFTAGTSLIHSTTDNFNLMLEALIQSSQQIDGLGRKSANTHVYLNPGVRFAFNIDYKDIQIVPGISFPVEVINAPTERSILFYFSVEPKLY